MRFNKLIIGDLIITNQKKIIDTLEVKGFDWLIDSEIEDAIIEIKKETLIWHGGDYFTGNWDYGIFKSGNFYGTFVNGIFEGGNFKGKFLSGIKV